MALPSPAGTTGITSREAESREVQSMFFVYFTFKMCREVQVSPLAMPMHLVFGFNPRTQRKYPT